MPVIIAEVCNGRKRTVATLPTYQEAKDQVHADYRLAWFADDDNFADCADFILSDGRQFLIEPEGFKL